MKLKKLKYYVLIVSALLVSALLLFNGCSVKHAVNQPPKPNFDLLLAGIERDWVRTEFGEATPSVKGDECETYSLVEGSSGFKYFRAFIYAILDIGTLGIMEIINYPIESSIGNDKIRLRVCYDENQKLIRAEKFEGEQGMEVLVDSMPNQQPKPPLYPPADNLPPVIYVNETTRSIKLVSAGQRISISGQVKDDSEVAEVILNGNQIYFDENGNFSQDVILSRGQNIITIEALDIFQNKSTKKIVINVP